jgi:hypothetical protein
MFPAFGLETVVCTVEVVTVLLSSTVFIPGINRRYATRKLIHSATRH